MASIFTCLCNYNTEMCGMAMAQTVVPVYTIPNTYWVQQSLWESLCQIIPGIARTSGSELRSTQLAVPNNTPAEQPNTTSGTGDSSDPEAKATKSGTQTASASKSSRKKRTSQETQQGEIPLGIPPAGSHWVRSTDFQTWPTIDLADDGNPAETQPPNTSTPIKAAAVPERRLSGKKVNVARYMQPIFSLRCKTGRR